MGYPTAWVSAGGVEGLACSGILTYCVLVKTDDSANRVRDLDLYSLLNIRPDASHEEIRRAYRRGALDCHPDKHPDDVQAAKRFVLLTQARDVLLNPAAREAYDRLRRRHGMDSAPEGSEDPTPRRRTRKAGVADPLDEQRLAERARKSRLVPELIALWQAGSIVVRAAILRNPSCPAALFSDPHVEAHWMLSLEAARRAQCPPEVLAKLALSFEHCVAAAVSTHPRTPADALCVIAARHRDLPILNALAAHQHAGPDVLRDLSRAVRGPRSASLGAAILAHPCCPADVAQRIRSRLGDMVA